MSNDQGQKEHEQRLKEIDDRLGELMDEYAEIFAALNGESDDPNKDVRLNVAFKLIQQAAESNVEALGMIEGLKQQAHREDSRDRMRQRIESFMGGNMR